MNAGDLFDGARDFDMPRILKGVTSSSVGLSAMPGS